MLLEHDYIDLGPIPAEVLKDLQEIAHTVDWNKSEFNRNDYILHSQLVRVPYGIRNEFSQPITADIKKILEAFAPIDEWMHSVYSDHIFLKGEICCLMPHDELPFHVDPVWWHQHGHRIHIPIITNDHCFWCVDDREHHFSIGRYYDVNNRRYHTSRNGGSTIRLHVILDILDKNVYNQAKNDNIDIEQNTFNSGLYQRQEFFDQLPMLKNQIYY